MFPFSKHKKSFGMGQMKGQTAVEYILLVSVSAIVAMIIVTAMVSREEGNEGFIIKAWKSMVDTIGSDKADGVNN